MQGSGLLLGPRCCEHAERGATLAGFGCRTRCHGVAFGRQEGGERAGLRLDADAIQLEVPLPNRAFFTIR
jgi:hypothetical protein